MTTSLIFDYSFEHLLGDIVHIFFFIVVALKLSAPKTDINVLRSAGPLSSSF